MSAFNLPLRGLDDDVVGNKSYVLDNNGSLTLLVSLAETGGKLVILSPETVVARRDEVIRAVNAHDRLVEALEAARGALVDESYGPFPGGDPRSFEPDHEVCTAEEIEAHRLACIAWDKGEGEDRGPSCATFGDGSAWTRTGYGVGTYTWEHDVVPAIDAALALARGEVE